MISIISCNQNKESGKNYLDKQQKNIELIKQAEEDLLIGLSDAICYSGFRTGQHPDRGDGAINPSYQEIHEDLNIISKSFKLLRVYDSGENSEMVLKVIKENNIEIKVMLGIWLRAEISNHKNCEWLDSIPDEILRINKELNIQEINKGIQLAIEYPEIIVAVNVGNEALVDWTDHLVDVDTMISYVKQVKKSINQHVTVAENYKWWANHGSALAKELDFIAVHVYPIWENKDIDEGLSYTIENLLEVRNALPESKIVISEAGWASIASEFGDRASEEKQLQYYNELMPWTREMNITTFIFEAFDEEWKGDPNNPLGAEKHWGLFTVDRKPKKVMHELYSYLNEKP
jgi:exo-beta-1,3-glucanase (GH17 family)